jgi:hypothetical protein
MPILRYFLFVGGTLFALLVLADAVLPNVPLPASLTSASDLPPVRIRSARQWPERIVMDTTNATPAPAQLAKAAQPAPAAVLQQTATTNPRDALAQMNIAEAKPQSVVETPHAAARMAETTTRSAEAKKRKAATRAHPGKPMILVAQQPHAGALVSTW